MATSVLATLVSPEGRRHEVLAALTDLRSAATDHEPGTLLFLINEHRDDPGTFSVFETYADQAAVDAHRGSAAMERFRAALTDLNIRPTLVFMTPTQ
jgi:quinol monooxygenase YgiN